MLFRPPTKTEIERELCRQSFWEYRQIIHPDLVLGWWQEDLASHLQQFYDDLIQGKRPKLAISAPPQHGKSSQIIDFISWLSGKKPSLKTIYGSFSENLGIKANTDLQRIYDSQEYHRAFDTRISADAVVTQVRPRRNKDILEYLRGGGYFRNTTVLGAITGEGLDFGIIDDPIKGRAEASSPAVRNKVWDWFTNDFLTRFSNDAGFIWIMTRWHLDDPLGRALKAMKDIKVVTYKAIATEDEKHRKAGEALFPQFKTLEFLNERKQIMKAAHWEAVYQQQPTPESGKLIAYEKIEIVSHAPALIKTARYWDTAGTEGGGCYTAGIKLGRTADGRTGILDVVRGQWSRARREDVIKQTAQLDGHSTPIYIERQGGSSGKEVVQDSIRNLSGFTVYEDCPTGDKILRSEPFAAQIENGNVFMVKADWNKAYLDEMALFPDGFKDQVDASSGAFLKLSGPKVDIW
jgi:predicted phage terminase large subunit-like protein